MTLRPNGIRRKCGSWPTALLLSALLIFECVPAGAQTKPWLAQLHLGTQVFAISDGKATATLPAVVEGADARKIRVAAVSLFQRANNRVINLEGKEVTYLPAEDGGTARLHVELAVQQLPEDARFGQYDLLLDVWEGDRKGPPATLNFTFPESVFAQPERVVLKISDVFGALRTVEPAAVWLRVSEGPAPATARLSQAGPALLGNQPVGGLLAFDPPPPLDKRAPAQVAVREAKEFPRGESTGQILLTGPDNKPVTIPFAVQVRSLPIIVSLIALVGVCMGWFIRTCLVKWQEDRQVELQTAKVRDALAGALQRWRHKALHKTVADLQSRLQDAFAKLKQSDASAIAEITKVQEDLNAAIASSEAQRSDILGRIATLKTVLKAGWRVPAALTPSVDAAVYSMEEACGQALRWDMDAADEVLAETERELNGRLNDWLGGWTAGKVRLRELDELCLQEPNLGVDARDAVTKLLAADAQEVGGGSDGLRKGFENVHRIMGDSILLRDHVLVALELTCETVARSLQSRMDARSAEAMAQARQDIAARRSGGLQLPEGLSETKNFVQEKLAVCRDTVISAKTEAIASVDEALTAHDYRRAAEQLVTQLAGQRRSANLGGAASSGVAAPPVMAPVTALAVAPPAVPPTPTRVLVHMPATAAGPHSVIDISVPETLGQIAKARAVQLGFSILGFSALAYPIFGPTFIGTVMDIFGVWAWGFTMDLGVGGLVQQLQARFPAK